MHRYFTLLFCLIGHIIIYGQNYNPLYDSPIPIQAHIAYDDGRGNEYSGGSTIASGEYIVIYGQDEAGKKEIRKPFILLEGMDFDNTTEFVHHIALFNDDYSGTYSSLLEELYLHDYDVIILDYDYGADYIQKNAYLLIRLLQEINYKKLGNEENIVMGFSMGGLVVRFALTYMENKDMAHDTRLFISYDSPHKGANVPMGLQNLIVDWIWASPGFIQVVLLPTLNRNEYLLPAALQMMVYHYQHNFDNPNDLIKSALPHPEKYTFFDLLYSLSPGTNGYPGQMKKIAVANGAENGSVQSNNGAALQPGDVILTFDYWQDYDPWVPWPLCVGVCCGFWDFSGCFDHQMIDNRVYSTVRAGFPSSQPLDELIYQYMGLQKISGSAFDPSTIAYDHLPGSYVNYMDEIASELDVLLTDEGFAGSASALDNICFIPTFSALDLDLAPHLAFNADTDACKSPFNYIHADDQVNQHHIDFPKEARDFILEHVGITGPEEDFSYLENYTVPAKTLGAWETYAKKVTNKIETSGTFRLLSNNRASLRAGNEIKLKPGFHVNTTSTFLGRIKPIKMIDKCHLSLPFEPHYISGSNKRSKPALPDRNPSAGRDLSSGPLDSLNRSGKSYRLVQDHNPNNTNIHSVVDKYFEEHIQISLEKDRVELRISPKSEIPVEEMTITLTDGKREVPFRLSRSQRYNYSLQLRQVPPHLLISLHIREYTYSRFIK